MYGLRLLFLSIRHWRWQKYCHLPFGMRYKSWCSIDKQMPMKRILRPVFLVLMLSLSGCLLFGWHENGDPTPTLPEIENWTKLNTDKAQRMKDWISCGGNSSGHVVFSPSIQGRSFYDESVQGDKEYDAAQACMMKKGYKFIGSCRGPLSGRLSCKGKSIFNL